MVDREGKSVKKESSKNKNSKIVHLFSFDVAIYSKIFRNLKNYLYTSILILKISNKINKKCYIFDKFLIVNRYFNEKIKY
jgi:hypothetical protein